MKRPPPSWTDQERPTLAAPRAPGATRTQLRPEQAGDVRQGAEPSQSRLIRAFVQYSAVSKTGSWEHSHRKLHWQTMSTFLEVRRTKSAPPVPDEHIYSQLYFEIMSIGIGCLVTSFQIFTLTFGQKHHPKLKACVQMFPNSTKFQVKPTKKAVQNIFGILQKAVFWYLLLLITEFWQRQHN